MGTPYRHIEEGYIRDLDRERQAGGYPEYPKFDGFAAEQTVVDWFRSNFPRIKIRPASKGEDIGFSKGGKAIDAVAYLEGKPALGMQITTATNSAIRMKKMEELKDKPFLRLEEMKPGYPSIPRVLIFLDNQEVERYLEDQNFEKHPKIAQQILEGTIRSLQFVALKTKDPEDQERIGNLLLILQEKLDKIKPGKPS